MTTQYGQAQQKNQRRAAQTKQRRFACGQATVEMAMLLPLFLSMIFAVIEIGRFWGARHAIAGAVREGARVMLLPYGPGTQYDNLEAVKTAAIKATQIYLNAAGLAHEPPVADVQAAWINPLSKTLDLSMPSAGFTRGDKVGIKISFKFESPLKTLLAGGDGVMLIEQACVLDHE
jgi:hypothetical protein